MYWQQRRMFQVEKQELLSARNSQTLPIRPLSSISAACQLVFAKEIASDGIGSEQHRKCHYSMFSALGVFMMTFAGSCKYVTGTAYFILIHQVTFRNVHPHVVLFKYNHHSPLSFHQTHILSIHSYKNDIGR